MRTHEDYIREIAAFAVMHADLNPTEYATLAGIKLVYGSGPTGTRGVTFYGRWKSGEEVRPFVEVSAFGQESIVQLTGTTLHELGHVLAGWSAGHGREWHSACERLGLVKIHAAGTDYKWGENFAPWIESFAKSIAPPDEGSPISVITNAALGIKGGYFKPVSLKGCQAGIGTRGGRSRGPGSGSRLRLWQCSCGCKVRAATDNLDATHDPCGTKFEAR